MALSSASSTSLQALLAGAVDADELDGSISSSRFTAAASAKLSGVASAKLSAAAAGSSEINCDDLGVSGRSVNKCQTA